jgi:hypothetical protein
MLFIHMYTHTNLCTYTFMYIHMYIYTHMYIHTYVVTLNLLKTWPPPIFPSFKSYPVSTTNLKNVTVASKKGTGDNEAIRFLTLFILSSILAFDSCIDKYSN